MPAASTVAPAPQMVHRPQHMQALERANEVRLARARLKRAVAAGKKSAVEIVVNCPWEANSMPISELLAAQRRWGKTRSRKFLRSMGLAENKPIGTLTVRQRQLVAGELR